MNVSPIRAIYHLTTRMKTSTIVWVIVIILIIIGGWYWFSMSSSNNANTVTPGTSMSSTTPAGTGQSGSNAVIGSNLALGVDSDATLGSYLIGYNGMAVYAFASDTNMSTCYGSCAQVWPPYIISPSDNITHLQSGVTGTVGTVTRTDNSLQLTYNGHPLYFYAHDTTSAPPAGQSIQGWSLVKP